MSIIAVDECLLRWDMEQLDQLLGEEPKGTVSFWGTRYLTIPGLDNSTTWLNLEWLTSKVNTIAQEVSSRQDISSKVRDAGRSVVRKIQNAYKRSDEEVKHSNLFTRFFVWIREFTFIPYTTRYFLEETSYQHFHTYEGEELRQKYGHL